MPITTDYDTFATRYHGSIVEISHSEDTPDEFFDALDEFFGTDDGYTHHLSRIYAMKDKIASLQASEAKAVLAFAHLHQTRMEAENEKLQEELDRAPEMRYTGEEMEKMVNVMEHIDEHPDYEETIGVMQDEYEDDIKNLKEENERILDRGSQVASDLFIENEKLKAENTLLTGQLISSKAVIEELS